MADAAGNVPPGSAPVAGPVGGKTPFNPTTDRILDKQTLPGGYTQVTYLGADGQVGVALLSPQESQQAGGGGGAATQGQSMANQLGYAQLGQNNEQFYQNMGYEKAKFNIQQNYQQAQDALAAANNSRDFAAAQHWNQVAQDLKQQQFQLDQQAQQFGQYTKLADLASNPRNFVQTFFMNRGQTPPPDVANYGNTNMNASQIPSFQQFQQKFMGAAGGGVAAAPSAPTYANPVVSQTGAQYPQGTQLGAAGNSVYGSSYQGLSGFDAATGKPRLSPNDPDAAGLMAKNPGMYVMTSPEEAMKYLPQKPPTMYAKGGRLHMMGPHAVINLMTGKTVAIAGERGPENAYFDGAALIDPSIQENPYTPNTGEVMGPEYGYPSAPTGAESTIPLGGSYNPYEPVPAPAPDYGGLPTSGSIAPTQTWTQADLDAMIAAANAGNTTTTAPPPGGGGGATGGTTYVNQPATYTQPATALPQAPQDTTTTADALAQMTTQQPNTLAAVTPPSIMQMPGALPQSNYQTGETTYSPMSPVSNITPASVAPAGTFGQPIPSTMPSYLAGENFQAASPVTAAVQNLPFMKRLYGQARGDASMGTNTPQRTDLPPDLPLISSLAWQQLAPSEQQAFLSYVSSLGVTPEDYLAMIQQNSPTGGASYQPLFGNQTPYARQ